MNQSIRTAKVATLAALCIAALAGPLLSATTATAAAPQAVVTSSPANGVRFTGSDTKDQVVFTRAGTPTAPLVVIDAAAPLIIGAGCQAVPGDPTRATCAAPLASGTTLKQITVTGGDGDDLFAHGASLPIPMFVNGQLGNDTVNGGPGQDTMLGGIGNDTLRGGDNTDTISGSSGDDVLDGGPGRDDNLSGASGADRLFGGEGDSDDLDGGSGPDQLDGGPGRLDIVIYDSRSNSVTVDLTTANDPDSDRNGETDEGDRILSGVENVAGGDGNDFLVGDDGDNNLLGGGGTDIIMGGKGQDAVIGQDGDDTLTGNTFSLFVDAVNSDGVVDFIGGLDGFDTCVRSTQDGDSVNECESVSVDN